MNHSYEANLYYRNFSSGVVSAKPRNRRVQSRSFVGVHSTARRSSFGGGFGGSGFSARSQMRTSRRINRRAVFGAAGAAGRVAVGGVVGVGSLFKESGKLFGTAWKAATNIRSGRMKVVIQPSMVIIGLILVAVSLSLVQLAHYNLVSTKGYELRRLEADRQQLLGSFEVKNMKLAEVKSLSEIAGSVRASAMVRPATIEYVRGNTALAKLP